MDSRVIRHDHGGVHVGYVATLLVICLTVAILVFGIVASARMPAPEDGAQQELRSAPAGGKSASPTTTKKEIRRVVRPRPVEA